MRSPTTVSLIYCQLFKLLRNAPSCGDEILSRMAALRSARINGAAKARFTTRQLVRWRDKLAQVAKNMSTEGFAVFQFSHYCILKIFLELVSKSLLKEVQNGWSKLKKSHLQIKLLELIYSNVWWFLQDSEQQLVTTFGYDVSRLDREDNYLREPSSDFFLTAWYGNK